MTKTKNNLLIFIIIFLAIINILLILYILKNNSNNSNKSNNFINSNKNIKNTKIIDNKIYQSNKSNLSNTELNVYSKKIYELKENNYNNSKLENKKKIIQEFYNILESKNKNTDKNTKIFNSKKYSENKIIQNKNYNIAFTTNENGYNEIVLGYLDKNNYKISIYNKIDIGSSDNAYPAFSNKGDKLAFVSNKDGNYNIHIYDLKNNTIERVTNFYSEDDRYNYYPTWDFNDNRIFFITLKGDYTYLKYSRKILDKKPVLKFIDLRNKQVYELLNGVISFCIIDYNTLLVSYTKIFDNDYSYYSYDYNYYNYDSLYGIYKIYIDNQKANIIYPSVENTLTSNIVVNPTKTMLAYYKDNKIYISSIDIVKDEKSNSFIRIKKEIPVLINNLESMNFIDSENIILSCKNSGNYDLYLLNIQNFKLTQLTNTIYDESSPSYKP
ncbi:MAG: hypothetical protein ACP5O4_06070 [bacterium]